MKQISILGWHPLYAEVIIEVLKETFGPLVFDIYLNVDTPNLEAVRTSEGLRAIHLPNASGNAHGACCFGTAGPWNKKKIFEDFLNTHGWEKADYLKIIHPTSYVAGSAFIDNGCFIEPMCTVSTAAHISFGTTLKRGVHIGHHNHIGAFCDINPGVIISGSCVVGDGTTLGSGTVVRDRVSIGRHCMIGMGSVVTSNIPDGMLAFGNPCKVIRPFLHKTP